MVLVAITGGNGDAGVEACKQLSNVEEVTKIIITCRTDEKATRTIDLLVSETGKDRSFFEYYLLDISNYASIEQAAKIFPSVDRLCLNVGALGKCEMHECGATDGMVLNALGHAVFFDKLMELGKIEKGCRVVYVGSEVSHDIYSFSGLLPHYYGNFKEKDIEWAITKNYDDLMSKLLPVRAQLGDYKNAKIIAQLFFAHMAKEYPDIHVMTVSPGAIGGKDGKGTGFANEGFFPLNVLMKKAPYLFKWIGVTHTIEEGVSRYIDGVLTGDSKWKTGAIVMSAKDAPFGLFFWGARGSVTDVRPIVPYLNDEDLAEKTAVAVRDMNSKWEKM